MEFLTKWKTQIDSMMEFMLVALVCGAIMAFFSPKIQIRYLLGSVMTGAMAGALGSYFFETPAVGIGLTILGVLTAPVTIAKLSGMTLWEAVDTLRSKVGPAPKNDPGA